MAIEKIVVENFTVFERMDLDLTQGINVVLGENGTGKTHVLKFVYNVVLAERFIYGTGFDGAMDIFDDVQSYEWLNYKNMDLDPLVRNRNIDASCTLLSSARKCTLCFCQQEKQGSFSHNITKNNLTLTDNLIFIPAKDMLTHSKGLLEMKEKYGENMPFDESLLDIIKKAKLWKLDKVPEIAQAVVPMLEGIIEGKIIMENDAFFVEKHDGAKIAFDYEAEGIKKFGLLWQLLMNESITKDTVLLWDEPEANINPKLIPVLVEILLELSRQGVQMFLTTHDYLFAKYFEVKRRKGDNVLFHSFYKTEEGVKNETNENFRDLKVNPIIAAFDSLMDEVLEHNLGD